MPISIYKRFFLLLVCILTNLFLFAQKFPGKHFNVTDTSYQCYYEGSLKISANQSLRLGLCFTIIGDTIHVVADSPDQYTFNISVKNFSIKADTISCQIPTAMASFKGNFVGDNLVGVFVQRGRKFKTTLYNMESRVELADLRPQNPKPPFPYAEINLNLPEEGSGAMIEGTLVSPKNPKALLILVSGSGWQNRDEFYLGHSPFWVLADHLARAGYATYRYDDRPHSLFATSTTYDFVEDLHRVVHFFIQDSLWSTLPIGVAGHSEGGYVALMEASKNSNVDFVVAMAGGAQSATDVLLYQVEAILSLDTNISPTELQTSLKLSSDVYKKLVKCKSTEKFQKFYLDKVKQITKNMSNQDKERLGYSINNVMTQINTLSTPWFKTFLKIKPQKYLKQVKVPVLALNGTKDLQVCAEDNLQLMKQSLPPHEMHHFAPLEGLNHLFQEADTGHPDEYGKIQQTLSPVFLSTITLWLDSYIDFYNKNIK